MAFGSVFVAASDTVENGCTASLGRSENGSFAKRNRRVLRRGEDDADDRFALLSALADHEILCGHRTWKNGVEFGYRRRLCGKIFNYRRSFPKPALSVAADDPQRFSATGEPKFS